MDSLNVIDSEGLKEYISNTFSEQGYSCVENYLESLIQIYLSDVQYPFKQNIVLGLPMMKDTQEIKSKEELLGRIKSLMMLLGKSSISINFNGTIVEYKLGDSQ